MPELPEVEVLIRHLAPGLTGKRVRHVQVHRPKIVLPDGVAAFRAALAGASFTGLARRGKYLVFTLQPPRAKPAFKLIGHLGMTGRMYFLPPGRPLPKHVAVSMDLGPVRFIFEDTRYFGRLTLDASPLDRLGPEPLSETFTAQALHRRLQRSARPVKVCLLDQHLAAGIGNIYASEALHAANVSPVLPARELSLDQVSRLRNAIRRVLRRAIRFGSTVPLDGSGSGRGDGLFYYGRAPGAPKGASERLAVYDRAGLPCARCGGMIRQFVQAGRSTYHCPDCQG